MLLLIHTYLVYNTGTSSLVTLQMRQSFLHAVARFNALKHPSDIKINISGVLSNCWNHICKVEKILEGSLDSIPSPSPSVKIQIMDGKVCFRCRGKTLLGDVNKLFVFKSLLTMPSNVLPLHLKQTFPSII